MSPAFDYEGTLKRFGQDERLFNEMVGFFFDDAPKWLDSIRAGMAKNDLQQIHRGAHTIKGMVSNFGAARVMAAAAQIEQHVAMRNLAAAQRALPLLEEALDELEHAFSEQGFQSVSHANDSSSSDR
jgi:HPt (histidine-containing phosphotransfer) domain-containing protein